MFYYFLFQEGLFISLEKVDSSTKESTVGGEESKNCGSKITAKTSKGHDRRQKYDSAAREHKERTQRDRWRRSNREPHHYHSGSALCTVTVNQSPKTESTEDLNSALTIEKPIQTGDEKAASMKASNQSACNNDSRSFNIGGKRRTRKPHHVWVRGEHEKECYADGNNGRASRGFSDGECVEGDNITKSRANRVNGFRDSADSKSDLQFSERSNKHEPRDRFQKFNIDERRGSNACESANDILDTKFNERSSKVEESNQSEKLGDRRVKSAQYDSSNYRNGSSGYGSHDSRSIPRGTNSNFRHFESRARNGRHRHFDCSKEKIPNLPSSQQDVDARCLDDAKSEDVDVRCLDDAKSEDVVLNHLVKKELPVNSSDARQSESVGCQKQLERLDTLRQVCKTANDEKKYENDKDYAKCLVDRVDNMVDKLATTSLESGESRRANRNYGRDNRLQGSRQHASNTSRNYNRNHRPEDKARSNNQERNDVLDRNCNEVRIPHLDALEKSDQRQQSIRKKPRDFDRPRPVNDRRESVNCISSRDDSKQVAGTQARRTDESKRATYRRRTGAVLLPTVPASHQSDTTDDVCVGVEVSGILRESSNAGSFHPPGFFVSSGLPACALSSSSVPSA